MLLSSLADAVEKQPEPPCTCCKHFDWCAKEQIACDRFGAYVEGWAPRRIAAASREPTRDIYIEIHTERFRKKQKARIKAVQQ